MKVEIEIWEIEKLRYWNWPSHIESSLIYWRHKCVIRISQSEIMIYHIRDIKGHDRQYSSQTIRWLLPSKIEISDLRLFWKSKIEDWKIEFEIFEKYWNIERTDIGDRRNFEMLKIYFLKSWEVKVGNFDVKSICSVSIRIVLGNISNKVYKNILE